LVEKGMKCMHQIRLSNKDTRLLGGVDIQADDILTVLFRGTNLCVHLRQACRDQGAGRDLNWDGDITSSQGIGHGLDCDLASTERELAFDVSGGITFAGCNLDATGLDDSGEVS